MDINYIYTKIKNSESYINGWREMKRSSVIIPLVKFKGELCILFEVRAKTLRKQPGDVCFPGGGIEIKETPKEAALREIQEELGFKSINIINELDILVRNNSIIIHSFVGEIEELEQLNINKEEVDHIFYLPVDDLLKLKPIEAKSKMLIRKPESFPYELIVGGENYKFPEGDYKAVFYKYENHVIWGITAAILENFINIIK